MRIAGCILMMGIMFAFPEVTAEAARDALRVWGLDVIPSLFPYMVISQMLSGSLSRKRFPIGITASTLGLIGGSPSGAAAIHASAEGSQLSTRSLYTLCALTGTISPFFILNTVGLWLPNDALTTALLTSHYLGALIAAALVYLILSKKAAGIITQSWASSTKESDPDPIRTSVQAVLNIGGCIVFFSVISAGIGVFLPTRFSSVSSLLHAMMEIAGGMKQLNASGFDYFPLGVLAAACLGFSGISMLTQNLLFLKPLGLRMRELVILGLLRAICSVAVMVCIFPLTS